MLCDLAEVLLKTTFLNLVKTLKQKRVTATGTKFVSPYSILFMGGHV